MSKEKGFLRIEVLITISQDKHSRCERLSLDSYFSHLGWGLRVVQFGDEEKIKRKSGNWLADILEEKRKNQRES